MKLTRKLITTFAVSGFLLFAALPSKAAQVQYNFSFELTNTTGTDLFTDGSFFVDPTTANTSHGSNAAGQTFAAPVDTLAFSVFDLGTTQNVGVVNYGKTNLQNTGLVYFSSLTSTAQADPSFTLSAPDATGFLTLVLNGSTASFYQGTTLGSTTGSPLVTGSEQMAQSLDASPVPEPASATLLIAGAVLLLASAVRLKRQKA